MLNNEVGELVPSTSTRRESRMLLAKRTAAVKLRQYISVIRMAFAIALLSSSPVRLSLAVVDEARQAFYGALKGFQGVVACLSGA